MPRAAVARARLLDQQVVVEHPHGRRAHQRAGDRGQRGALDRRGVLRDPLPVAEVLDERARVAGPRAVDGERAGSAQVALHARLEQRRRCSGSSTPRSSTTPSRRKSSTSWGSTAGTGRETTARRRGPRTARTRRGAAAGSPTGCPTATLAAIASATSATGSTGQSGGGPARRRGRRGGAGAGGPGRSASRTARSRPWTAAFAAARRSSSSSRVSRPAAAWAERRSAAAARSASPTRRSSCGWVMPSSIDIERFDIKRTAGGAARSVGCQRRARPARR